MSEHWPYDVMAEKDREIDDLKRQLAGSESRASEILGHYKAEKARREQADAMLDELDELLRDYMPARIGLAKTVLARRSGGKS